MRKAIIYVRVSTKRQADHEISISEQEAYGRRCAEREGYAVSQVFVERGGSGLTDRRPEFQKMIASAMSKPRQFEAVIVYNFSRSFREDHLLEAYRRKLEKAGVNLLSATQTTGEGPYGDMTRKIVAAVDNAYSEINAAQVAIMMTANASAGFWNGSTPPLGYRTYVAEHCGKKQKKRLEIDPMEASQVRDIFARYLGNDGSNLGVAGLGRLLNAESHRHRGQKFSPSLLHAILTRETYIGTHYFNKTNSRERQPRPREDWIKVDVPRIIDDATFDAVQRRLASRNPSMAPARSHSTPVLLSGIALCGCCNRPDATMMMMTGKGGRYQYYTCSQRRRLKEVACGGNTVVMKAVDDAVLQALEKRLFEPTRLRTLLGALIARSDQTMAESQRNLSSLRVQLSDNKKAFTRLLMLVENGTLEADDTEVARQN